MNEALPLEDLIALLRARAADPDRRTTSRPTASGARVRTMDLGDLLAMVGGAAGRLERETSAPAPIVLPAPADPVHAEAIEAQIGVALPSALRRVYMAVADGGFGPGEGILPLSEVARQYQALRAPGVLPRGREWPVGMLPLVAMEPGWDCVDAATGRVIAWDPDELDDRSSQAAFDRSFRVMRPSVEAWLTAWVDSRTQAEVMDAQMRTMREAGTRWA
jgi:hypothetical protein